MENLETLGFMYVFHFRHSIYIHKTMFFQVFQVQEINLYTKNHVFQRFPGFEALGSWRPRVLRVSKPGKPGKTQFFVYKFISQTWKTWKNLVLCMFSMLGYELILARTIYIWQIYHQYYKGTFTFGKLITNISKDHSHLINLSSILATTIYFWQTYHQYQQGPFTFCKCIINISNDHLHLANLSLILARTIHIW